MMKRIFTPLFVLAVCLFFQTNESNAQCNTNICSVTPPPALCASGACIMCDPCLLNGYMGQTVAGSNTCNVPGPFCGSIENNQWFAFMAPPSGTVTFNFTVSNCTGTPNGSGIQAEIYSTGDCNTFTSVSNCWSPGSAQNGSVTGVNLQPYCTYYLMIDGWAGDFCDFVITTTDCNTPPPPTPINIVGPSVVCPGATVQYTMNPAPSTNCSNNSNSIVWSGISPLGTIIGPNNGPTITVQWNQAGSTVINVATSNVCFGDNASIPKPVVIAPIPPTVNNLNVCLGDCVPCAGQLVCTPGPTMVHLTSWLGCDSLVICNINAIPPVFKDLGQVTLCHPQTLNICGTTINTCGAHSATCNNWQGCDSTVVVDLAILNPIANVAPPEILACGAGATVQLNGTASTTGCLPNVNTTYSWTGPPGGISGPSNQNTALASMAGQYCLTVTHSRNNVSCSNTKCVTVVKDNNVPQTPQISGNNNPCPNTPVTFTVTPVGTPAPTSYTWTSTGGTITGSGTSVSVSFPNPGPATVCVTANNNCGASNPACFNVNVANPPTATISGSGSVCMGSGASVDLTITLTGVGPWTVGYNLNNIPQTPPLTITSSPFTFTTSGVGTYTLTSVTGGAGCSGTVSGTGTVSEYPVPTASLSGSGSICQGSGQMASLTITLTGSAPWTVEWAVGGNAQAPLVINASPYTLMVGQAQAGNITLTGLTDGNGCDGTVSGAGMVTVNTAPTVSNIQIVCDATNTFYTVSFTINGGNPATYSVTPSNGTLTGNTFTSNQIFSSTGYSFVVNDANNCNPVTVAQSIVICDCETSAGTMDNNLIEECGDGPVTAGYDNTDEFLDGNDALVFILHSGNGVNIVNPIIGTYTSPTVSFIPGTMTYGTTYYLSAVVGDSDGSGGVDLVNDPCLDVAQGTPIVFYQVPTATLSGNPEVCTGQQAMFAVNFTGTGPWSITYNAGASDQTINGITNNPYTLTITPTASATVCLTGMSDTNCPGTADGCGNVTVNTAVTVSPPLVECNLTGTGYTVTFTISGGDPASYSVTPPGNLTGNTFVSNEMPTGNGFSFVVTDANNCGPKTVAQTEVDCSCATTAGMMGAAIQECGDGPVTASYDDANQVLDPDDVVIFILHTNSGASAGTIKDTNTTGTFSFNPANMVYGTTYYISAVVGNDDGAGGVVMSDPCTVVAPGTPVTFYEVPTATLTGSKVVCGGESVELSITFTGDLPWEVTIDGQVISNITTPDYTYTVTPSATTTYTLSGFSDDNCPGTISGSATVTVNYPPSIATDNAACIADTNTYSVNFTITGGNPASYTVTPPNGTLTGSSFTSNPIASNVPYQFIISDANNCGTDTISGVLNCSCDTDAGTMSATPKERCVNEGIAVTPTVGSNLDPNDVLVYYLHTGSGASLGTVLGTNNQPGFNFNPATMMPGVTYYISAVAGNNNGSGGIDLNDFCLDIAPGTPVLWNPLPTVALVASDAICAGQPATVTMTMNGVGPYNVSYSINGAPQSSSNVTSPFTFNFSPAAQTTIQMIAVTDLGAGCSSPSSESATIFVSQPVEAGMATADFEFCDIQTASVNLADNLTGADPGGVWTTASGRVVPGGTLNPAALNPGTYSYKYVVSATPPCISDTATVKIVIHPQPAADAGADHELDCDAVEVTLGGNNTTPGMNVAWTGGNVSDSTILHPTTIEPGTYTLTVTNPITGCTASDNVQVNQTITLPEPHLTISGVSCFGKEDGYILVDSVTNGLAPFLYSFDGGPFAAQKNFQNLSPGVHTLVIVDAAGCERSLEITVIEPEQVNVELVLEIEGNENIVTLGDSVKLVVVVTPNFDSLDAVIWTPAGAIPCETCQENWLHPTQNTTFSIMVNENGCTDEDEVTLFIRKERPVYIPNAFSPNNDGTNDIFHIYAGAGIAKVKAFLVFNRWGETVYQYYDFQPNDPAYGWDGTHRGNPMDPAVFTWFAEIEFIDGRVILYEGDVTLMR